MSGFQDQSIDEGVRKRTAYQNDRRARLALNVERQDGGILQIPVASDMLGHEEHERIQQNTFLAVMPLVRLPTLGKAGYGDQLPVGALPRAGRIYLFQDGKLWRELECDGKGNLFEVDLLQGRSQRADKRPAVGKTQALILVPVLVKGQFVIPRYTMPIAKLLALVVHRLAGGGPAAGQPALPADGVRLERLGGQPALESLHPSTRAGH